MLARDSETSSLKRTPLHALHLARGAKMVPFAGYEMPLQYSAGVMKEHLHTRSHAGLFDVSHMGQIALHAKSGHVEDAAAALERLVPQDIVSVAPGRQRYAQFTDDSGGILDDLMVANFGTHLFLVVNAACKAGDEAHLRAHLSDSCVIEPLPDRALLALQGPQAESVLAKFCADAPAMRFMDAGPRRVQMEGLGIDCFVSRSGYTGEDGFEISVPAGQAEALAAALLDDSCVLPIGLGARDSLRLEAGLCLYGHDIDTTTTPIEAGLLWSIGKERRVQGCFPGAATVQQQIADGAPRKRVGLLPEGKAIAREGADIALGGKTVGKVTSGGFAPTLGRAIAMGYVERPHSANGTKVELLVRGNPVPAEIVPMPFVKHAYYRG